MTYPKEARYIDDFRGRKFPDTDSGKWVSSQWKIAVMEINKVIGKFKVRRW